MGTSTKILYGITALIALVVLLDVCIPGKSYTDNVTEIIREKQKYYNAATNYHYSYKVVTPNHKFLVPEEFAAEAQDKEITYSVSLLFHEVNGFKLTTDKSYSMYSFRVVSGIILPLLILLILGLRLTYTKKVDKLLFILQIIMLLNLIKLMQ